jgi:heme oxygenase
MRRLREHTAGVHAATEALPLMRGLLAEQPTPAGYGRYLAALHGVYLAVEPALYAAVPPALQRALGVAPKLPELRHDLLAVGTAATEPGALLPHAGTSAVMRSLLAATGTDRTATALGGLYVLEGATLGGQVIARHLRAHWPSATPPPLRFLEFRGAHPGHGWRGFGTALDAWANRHPGSERAILDGALAIFGQMHTAFAAAGTDPNS